MSTKRLKDEGGARQFSIRERGKEMMRETLEETRTLVSEDELLGLVHSKGEGR